MIRKNKRGQVTIFVIIAIILVVAVALFFVLRDSFGVISIPESIQPAYSHFLSCVESEAQTGINVLESRGGYIELPEFEPGSSYMPFSSQLMFLGNPIPYWYYVSGNNLEKEQIPSREEMEEQLANFVEDNIRKCEFGDYYEEGFEITLGEPSVDVNILEDKVRINLEMDTNFVKGNDSALVNGHEVEVDSMLGGLYDSAKAIYDYEQSTLFLEEYGIDVLYSYAPVDGVEISCAPEIWDASEVFGNLREALQENTMVLQNGGEGYFSVNLPVNEEVNFMTSPNWPNAFSVDPSDESLLVAEPIGNQQGLSVLGFCYTPYHFVYDMKYPILIQVQNGEEIFQFPVAVVIDSNNPREPLDADSVVPSSPELCQYKNSEFQVNIYDTSLNSVEANISYECLGDVCDIGETSSGVLVADFPQCVNGYVIASAPGYEEAKRLFSTTESGEINIIMDRSYEREIDLIVDGSNYDRDAMIYFVSDASSETIYYPEQTRVSLSEGEYDIEVYIFDNTSIEFEGGTREQCVEVPQSGIAGVLGFTEQDCYEIEVQPQIISNALSGGGSQNYYITESELRNSNTIRISAERLPKPDSLEDLQVNYLLFEDKNLGISFI